MEKMYDRVNREALWQGLRMYDGGVKQGCIMFPWLFNVYIDAVMKEMKMGMWKMGVRFLEKWRKWK